MRIVCKKTGRFLCEIDTTNFFKNLEKLGISHQVPLILTIPCQRCKKQEIYAIYENHYLFKKNVDNKK